MASLFVQNSVYSCKYTKKHSRKGDRFIPDRGNMELSNYLINTSEEFGVDFCIDPTTKYVNFAEKIFKEENYKCKLWETVVNKSKKKVLNFGTSDLKSNENSSYNIAYWPVHPRKTPCISAPSAVLDMPGLKFNRKYNSADWGASGYLASVYCREVYLWHPEVHPSYKISKTNKRVRNCIKWDKLGNYLAVALFPNGFTVLSLNNVETKLEQHPFLYYCKCKVRGCHVSRFAWDQSGSLYIGCSKGAINKLNKGSHVPQLIHSLAVANILNLELSCKENYLAVLDMHAECTILCLERNNVVNVFRDLKEYEIRAIAWHPWKNSLLAVSDRVNILLYNVSARTKVCLFSMLVYSYQIDALTFNPLSAELVLSMTIFHQQQAHIMFVLSTPTSRVDGIQWHEGRVQYLLWGPNHMLLATAGADENMCIWNFFGPEQQAKFLKKSKGPSNSLLDLNSFINAIR